MGDNTNPQVPTGQTDATVGATGQQQNSNFISGNPALMASLKAMFAQIGQHMGVSLLSQAQQGNVTMGANPVIPQSMPQETPIGMGTPFVPRGNSKADFNTAVATKIGNDLNNMVNAKRLEMHNKEVAGAQRDYETIMNSIAINKSLDPNNPEHAKIIEHNKQIIDTYLNDPKKMKRLQKVLGIEADLKDNNNGATADAQKKAKLESDPDYQALQKAKANAAAQAVGTTMPGGGTIEGGMVPGGGPSAPTNNGGAPMSETIPGTGGATPTTLGTPASGAAPGMMSRYENWVSSMSPKAQAFINQFPVSPQMNYIPSPDEFAQQWRVAAKIAPDGDHLVDAAARVHQWNVRGLGEIVKTLNDRDIEQMKSNVEQWKTLTDNDTKWNIALLEAGIKKSELNLKGYELSQKNIELAQKNREFGANFYKGRVDELQKGLEYNRQLELTLTDAWDKAGKVDKDKIAGQLSKLNDDRMQLTTQYFSARGDWEKYYGAFGFNSTPTNTDPNAGANAVTKFDQRNQSSTGATGNQPAPSSIVYVPHGR